MRPSAAHHRAHTTGHNLKPFVEIIYGFGLMPGGISFRRGQPSSSPQSRILPQALQPTSNSGELSSSLRPPAICGQDLSCICPPARAGYRVRCSTGTGPWRAQGWHWPVDNPKRRDRRVVRAGGPRTPTGIAALRIFIPATAFAALAFPSTWRRVCGLDYPFTVLWLA